MKPIGALHVLPQRNLQIGGPAYSVPRLADSLAEQGMRVQLWSLDAPELGAVAPMTAARPKIWPATLLTRHWRGYSPGFARALRSACTALDVDLIHNHGLWMFPNRDARRAAVHAGKPLVCSPRGMLEAWSMQRSVWSKRLVWWAFEQRNLQSVAMFHATSQSEVESIRRAGLHQPIALIPNGIDMHPLPNVAQRTAARALFGLQDEQRILLFMSRLHEKKGLVPLLQAWKSQAAAYPHWHLYLAGPDLDGYSVVVRRTIEELGLKTQVTMTGMLEGDLKRAALHASDAFILPSHSENFGIAVAEAAMSALPIITTYATPWQGLIEAGGGWQVASTAPAITAALKELLSMDKPRLNKMGECARNHVIHHYAWPGLAQQMAQAYSWLTRQSEKPNCITSN